MVGDTGRMADSSSDYGALGLGLVAMTAMLALTILAQRVVSRTFDAGDPRRAVASRVVVWIATALLVVILLYLRR